MGRGQCPRYIESGRRSWATNEISWGIFGVPEDELRAPPADVGGMDVVELGCGTAYFSAWLARRGALVTGIVEFHIGFGDWVRLLRANRLEVLDFIEVQAPAGAVASSHALVDPEWARKWPAEQIWRVRKRTAVS